MTKNKDVIDGEMPSVALDSSLPAGMTAIPSNEPNAEAKAIVARLIATGVKIDINLPESLAEQQQWALSQYDNHVKSGLQFGYALVVIKEQLEHGEFMAWLNTNGIGERAARNNMKAAKFLGAIGDDSKRHRDAVLDDSNTKRASYLENRHGGRDAAIQSQGGDSESETNALLGTGFPPPCGNDGVRGNDGSLDIDALAEQEVDAVLAKIIKLPLRKQLELAKEHPDRIREYMQMDLFEEIDKMSPTEIRAVIRQQKEIERLRIASGNATNREFLKTQELAELKKLPKQHLQLDVMHKQLLQDGELIAGAMQRMRKIFEEAKHFTQEFDEDAKNLVAYPALHSLEAIQGHAYEIFTHYRNRWDITHYLPMGGSRFDKLTTEERDLILTTVELQQAATARYEAELKQAAAAERTAKRRKS